MSLIAIIDLIACAVLFVTLLILIFHNRIVLVSDIRILSGIIVFVTLIYMFFILLEWLDITHNLESVEDIIGASVPIMWAFFVYSYIKHELTEILNIHKENLRITLNSIGDGVIATDVSGRIIRMNPAASSLTGESSETAHGKKIDEVMLLSDPVSRKKIPNPVSKVLETGKVVKIGHTVLTGKENREYYIADTAAPIFNDKHDLCGAVMVFSDTTDRYFREEKIRLSEERLNLALNATRAGIWDWFIQNDKLVLNESWAEILGYKLSEIEPTSPAKWLQRVNPEDLIYLEELLESHLKGKTENVEAEIRLKHKNGEWIWVLFKGMVVQRDNKGNPLRITGTIVDITRQKNVEMELKAQIEQNLTLNEEYLSQNEELLSSIERIKKINEELTEAKKNAEESYKLKSAFLANMSHEIRTPMNGIMGFSELLKDPKLPADKRMRFAKIIVDSSHQLLNIVNDILDISRIETGKMSLVFEKVVINELLDILFVFFEQQSAEKNLRLKLSKSLDNEESTVVTDRTRLRQILTNLINNAIKFTHEGQVHFGYKLVKKDMIFFVTDTGIGISPDLHEKIFEPFRQAHMDMDTIYRGTGLGLTISRKLAGMLGGDIRLESKPGKGSTFYLSIPYRKESENEESETEKTKKTRLKVYDILVLIVEDDDVNYLFLETILSKNNITTLRASNGIEAVEMCKKDQHIDLVLMDIKLPLMNGYEATKEIKELRPDLPIIAQTAYAMHEDREKAAKAGCDGYIPKPIVASELLRLINNLLTKKTV